jgi:hypothetical protein
VYLPVSTHDRRLLLAKDGDRASIDDKVIWNDRETTNRALHREVCGPQDIEPIHFARTRGADSNRERDPPDLLGERLALCGGQAFGIIGPGDRYPRWQDDRDCQDGSGEWPAACLIEPGQMTSPTRPDRLL